MIAYHYPEGDVPASAKAPTAPAPTVEEIAASPYADHAEKILAADPTLDDATRSTLWDSYHSTVDPNELASQMRDVIAPEDTKNKLILAKQTTSPVPTRVEKLTSALTTMSRVDPKTLQIAQQHPNVAKALIEAATRE